MMALTLSLALAQPLNATALFRDTDGGWTLRTTTGTGGSSSTAPSYVNVLVDGGWLTVTRINPYDNVVVDGGAIVATQGPGEDGGRQWNVSAYQGTSPWTVGGFANVLLDGGWTTATVINPYVNALLDGGAVVATQGLSEDGGRAWNVALAYGPNPIGSVYLQFDAGLVTSRITGNAGAVIDAANNGTAPANVLVTGIQLRDSTTATAGTAGQVGSPVGSLDHVTYVREGGPTNWSCFQTGISATTECKAAAGAGLRHYVTSLSCSNQAATAQTVDVVFGTGTNCGTGTTALTHKFQMGTNATTTSPFESDIAFTTPLVPGTAATAICLRPSAATAFGCTLTGYTAP